MKRLWHIFLLLFSKSTLAKAENKHCELDIGDAENRIANKQTAYSTSFIYVAGTMFVSLLSKLGYETETYKGTTILETASRDSFKLFYLIGIYLLTLTLLLDGK